MNLFDLCNNSGILTVFLVIKILLSIICIILPIIIMFKAFSSMLKIVINGKDFSSELMQLVKSTVAALIVFLLPTLFQFLFVDLMKLDDTMVVSCFTNASLENINKLREEERVSNKEKLKEENTKKASDVNKQKEIEKENNKKKKELYEEYKKKKEEDEREQNSNSSSNVNFSNTGTINIFVGDSRTVGLCTTITGDSSGCSYSNGGAKYYNNDIFIAQGSMSYSWFNSTAIGVVNSILQSNPNTKYNIYSLMGVNMLLYDIDKYISSYNSLATGSWKNHNILLVSVNPVDEVKERQYGYSTKNNDIMLFNSKLRSNVSGNNVKYCDTYSILNGSLSTTDGLHYTSDTYRTLYNKLMSCKS